MEGAFVVMLGRKRPLVYGSFYMSYVYSSLMMHLQIEYLQRKGS